MASEGEGHTYSVRVDRCSLVRRETDYHRGIRLEVALDAGREYNPLVPNG